MLTLLLPCGRFLRAAFARRRSGALLASGRFARGLASAAALGHNRFLERFGRQKLEDALRGDFHRFAGGGITRDARGAIADLELPETRNLDRFAGDHRGLNVLEDAVEIGRAS